MTDHEAIVRTLARYCQLCDDGRFEEFAELWTNDATFEVEGMSTVSGRDGIKRFMEKAQPPPRRGKHMCGLPLIDIDADAGRASAQTDFVFVAGDGAITSAGRYHDRLRRDTDEQWRFTERRISFLSNSTQ